MAAMDNLIVKMVFGSHLYGTATEASDRDFKGIFMPSMRELVLQDVPKTKSSTTKHGNATRNVAEDVDEELYSLQYFLKLACEGQTVALDMLHAPKSALTVGSGTWDELQNMRSRFYTKNLNALVGYARRQAAKYGVKGSRLAAAKSVLAFLESEIPTKRLRDVWDRLPEGEHIHKELGLDWKNLSRPEPGKVHLPTVRMYDVCGKQLMETATVGHYIPALRAFVAEYGVRAEQAERNEGIDWKAVSHALRAGFQVRHILVDGGFEYPLAEAGFLREVKLGKRPYLAVAEQLEHLIDDCEALAASSSLPSKVDKGWWDDWLWQQYVDEHGGW